MASGSNCATATRRGVLLLALSSAPAFAEPARIAFGTLYKSYGVTGLVFADAIVGLANKPVSIVGYLAPPLKAESRFLVLTEQPLALCPFCQSDTDWPTDIVAVYLRRLAPLQPPGTRLKVEGRLEIGSWTDPENGFVSQLRIVDATLTRA